MMAIQLMIVSSGTRTPAAMNGNSPIRPGDKLELRVDDPWALDIIRIRDRRMRKNIEIGQAQMAESIPLGDAADFAPGIIITVVLKEGGVERLSYDLTPSDGSAPVRPEPVSAPAPMPAPDPARSDFDPATLRELEEAINQYKQRIQELTEQMAAEAEERDRALREAEASRAAKEELEKALELRNGMADLPERVKELRERHEELLNEEHRLKTFDLKDAEDRLAETRQRVEEARTNLTLAEQQEKSVEDQLQEAQAAMLAKREELRQQQQETETVEQALSDLRSRHTDAERARMELQEQRESIGMLDKERDAAQAEIDGIQARLAEIAAKEAETRAESERLAQEIESLNGDIGAKQAKIAELGETRAAIDERVQRLTMEIGELERIRDTRGDEWERLVRQFSELLSGVIRERFELEDTYNLLVKAMDSDLVEEYREEAVRQQAMLDECGECLAQVSAWIGEAKARKKNS